MQTKLRKAVIPVAGRGTRFLPVTHAVPKELLPMVDQPTLQYVVAEAAAAGIEEIILITAPRQEKAAIEHYFTGSVPEDPRLDSLRSLRRRLQFRCVVQPKPLGLGHAVLCAADAVGDEPFAVLLGDDLFRGEILPTEALIQAHQQLGGGHVVLNRVPLEQTHRYGVAEGAPQSGERVKISALVEKPAPGTARSDLAVAGRYVLPPVIFELLENTPPGVGGEIQLTDALARLIGEPGLYGTIHRGERYDTGEPAGYVLANLAFALERPELEASLREGLASLLGEEA